LGLESGKVCSDFARELERELAAAKAEVAKANAERDAARRELCRYKYRSIMDECPDALTAPQIIAENRGWDCFKEVTP
jgi:hypothetical protein